MPNSEKHFNLHELAGVALAPRPGTERDMSLDKIGFELDSLPVALTRERVIEVFDGDRIVLLRSGTNDPYLQIWSNTDGAVTRWFVMRITDDDLGGFLRAERALQSLILGARDGHVYLLDTCAGATSRVAFLRVADIPPDDLPAEDSCYDDTLTPTGAG